MLRDNSGVEIRWRKMEASPQSLEAGLLARPSAQKGERNFRSSETEELLLLLSREGKIRQLRHIVDVLTHLDIDADLAVGNDRNQTDIFGIAHAEIPIRCAFHPPFAIGILHQVLFARRLFALQRKEFTQRDMGCKVAGAILVLMET